MFPSGSLALAVSVRVAGPEKLLPLAGVVSVTVGAWLGADTTVTDTTDDTSGLPLLSKAFAVNEYGPA